MKNQNMTATQLKVAQRKFAGARSNLLLMIILTVVNIFLFAFGSDTMLLFSATVPYFASAIGIMSEDTAVTTLLVTVAVAVLLVYFFCWLFSKKHFGWMIAALVMFLLDTLCLVGIYTLLGEFSGILDLAIHIWVIYYLIVGAKYGSQLKNLPEEYAYAEVSDPKNTVESAQIPLRMADLDVKSRILLEADAVGHHICYRRVKRVNELVIDGYVYDEVEMLVESAHSLTAVIDGHQIAVGYDGARSYIIVDGETVAKRLRLY